RFAIGDVIVVKASDAVLKTALDRWTEGAGGIPAIEPPDGPLAAACVIGPQRERAVHSPRRVQQVLVDVGPAIAQVAMTGRPFKLHPFASVGLSAAVVYAPFTHQKVEIVKARCRCEA